MVKALVTIHSGRMLRHGLAGMGPCWRALAHGRVMFYLTAALTIVATNKEGQMDQSPSMPFYLSLLKEEFLRRKRRSSRYSLRAFARDLGLHPSTLSRAFNGLRPIPRHALQRLASTLGLNEPQKRRFFESYQLAVVSSETTAQLEAQRDLDLSVLANWDCLCAVCLFDAPDFSFESNYLQAKLGVSKARAQQIIDTLLRSRVVYLTAAGHYRRHHNVTTLDVVRRARESKLRELLEAKAPRPGLGKTIDLTQTVIYLGQEGVDRLRVLLSRLMKRAQGLRHADVTEGEVYELVVHLGRWT